MRVNPYLWYQATSVYAADLKGSEESDKDMQTYQYKFVDHQSGSLTVTKAKLLKM